MSYLRTSKRRRERQEARARTIEELLSSRNAAGVTVPWSALGLTRAQACDALGLDPDGGDQQFVVLDI